LRGAELVARGVETPDVNEDAHVDAANATEDAVLRRILRTFEEGRWSPGNNEA
jgi:hypothetical protein